MTEYRLLTCSVLVSAAVNLLGRLRRKRSPRILVVKLDHFGDVLMATPAVRALHEGHPGVPIDALVARGSTAALKGNPAVTRILHYDSPRLRRGGVRGPGERGGFRAMREVARGRYTTIVELRGDWWTLLLPFLTGAGRRVDRGSVRMGHWLGRFRRSRRARGQLHEVETNLEVVRPLLGGSRPRPMKPGSPATEIAVTQADRDSLRSKLVAAGADPDAPSICIHPGAAWRPKAWRPERFADVADWLQENYHTQVLFVGSAEEKDIEASVRTKMRGSRALWMAGALTWQEFAALLTRVKLFLGNDGGPAHLAAACGAPSIVLLGPQEPSQFRPWSERSIILHHRVHCCPCRQITCLYPENPCVNLIEIEEVQEQVRRILGPPPASG
jgi:heptosyltransferase-2/heptosyltransferase-3